MFGETTTYVHFMNTGLEDDCEDVVLCESRHESLNRCKANKLSDNDNK